jgi:hypothetical protein
VLEIARKCEVAIAIEKALRVALANCYRSEVWPCEAMMAHSRLVALTLVLALASVDAQCALVCAANEIIFTDTTTQNDGKLTHPLDHLW